MKILTASVLSLVALSGCASAPPPGNAYQVVIDCDLPVAFQEAVAVGAAKWEAATDGRLHLYTSMGDCPVRPYTICVHAVTAEWFDSNGGDPHWGADTRRDADHDRADVYVPFARDLPAYASLTDWLMAHELGHSLGLEHTTEGLMVPDAVPASPSVSCVEVAQWASLRPGESDVTKACPKGGSFQLL